MTSVNSTATSQAQLLLLQQQQLAAQNSLAANLNSQTSTSTVAAPSSPSSSTDATYQQSPVAQTFQQLSQAIQSGDLSGAQQAFSSLSQLTNGIGQYGQDGKTSTSGSSFAKVLGQIGSDLQSNNLAGAQETLGSLLDKQGTAHGSGGGKAVEVSSSSASSSPTAEPDTITVINSDGSVTTITTDADGVQTDSTQPASAS